MLIRFPAGHDDNMPISRSFDVNDPNTRAKLLADILDKNVKIFTALRDSAGIEDAVKRGLDMHKTLLDSAQQKITDLRQRRKEAVDAAENADKRKVAMTFEEPIRTAQHDLLAAYERVLGTARYRELAILVLEEKTDNIKKFIYVVDAEGHIRLCEESLEPGSERPAHSQLASGRNVYGAGEIYIRGMDVVSINNGSGHYRPDANENVRYVQKLLEEAGFKTDEVRFEHVKFPSVTIDMPVEELWHNTFLQQRRS